MKPRLCTILSVAVFVVAAAGLVHAQDQGRWNAHLLPDKKVYLELRGANPQQGASNLSSTLPVARLRNANFASGSANAHFSLNTEAGTVDFNGAVNGDTGSGTYTFTANPHFRKNMEQLKFAVAPEQQLLYALNDVTTGYAKSMHEATGVIEAGRVLKMARLQISPEFAHELSKAAGEKLETEEVIEAARHKVTPEYVAAVHKLLPHAEFDDVARLQRRGVAVQFIAAAQKCRAGVTAEQILELKKKYGSPCGA